MRTLVALTVLAAAVPAAAAEQGPIVVKLATVAPDGTPWAAGLKEFKQQVEKDSGGTLKVKLFLGGALGNENESVLACKRGQVQAMGVSTGALATQVPELSVLEMPYLFKTAEEADYVLQKALADKWEKLFRDRGFVLGFWSENGFRSFGTRAAPIRTPDDLKGKKMRSQEQPVHVEMYRAFGASPVPIPITETLTALQTGVVDGYDNTVLFSQASSFTSATKFFTLSEHIYQPAAIVFNAEFFATLTPVQQKALLAGREGLGAKILQQVRLLGPALEQNLVKFGIEVIHLDAATRAQFEAVGQKARAAYLAQASPGEKALAADVEKALATLRKGTK